MLLSLVWFSLEEDYCLEITGVSQRLNIFSQPNHNQPGFFNMLPIILILLFLEH